jgi:hypothetical protein
MTAESNIVNIEFIPEQSVRELRDNVYDTLFGVSKPISDHEWEQCKACWMEPRGVRWPLDHQPQTPVNTSSETTNNVQ